jgi:hypothetical protein
MLPHLATWIQSSIDSTLKYLGYRDPHNFEHSLKFIGWSEPKPIPSRNPKGYELYQNVVKAAIRKNLPGSLAEKIIYEYHHPVATLDSIVETLKLSDKPPFHVPIDHHYLQAWELTRLAFQPSQKLRPVHLADMLMYKWNWHPNVEAPFSNDKLLISLVSQAAEAGLLPDARMSFGNLKNVVFKRVREFMHQIKRSKLSNPSHLYPTVTIHTKPALSKIIKTKVRVIAGVSKLHVIPSAQRFWPLFRDWIENRKSPMLWGYETLLGGMLRLHHEMLFSIIETATFLAIDWPNYDLGVLHDERSRCYDTYESYFEFDKGYIPTKMFPKSEADPQHLRKAWQWIKEATHRMPLVLPDGSTYIMNDQFWFVYSGLFQTQSDDSVINHARLLTILSALGFIVTTQTRLKVQGDDSVIRLYLFIPADQHDALRAKFIELAEYYFNSTIKEDSAEISNNGTVEILGYRNSNGFPLRDEEKLIAMLLHPRGSPTLETLMAKCVGFMYASMYQFPYVTAICKQIWTQLRLEGYSPAKLHIQRDVILQGEATFTIDTDHFPSPEEVTKHLRTPYNRTFEDRNFYFPTYDPEFNYFLDVC